MVHVQQGIIVLLVQLQPHKMHVVLISIAQQLQALQLHVLLTQEVVEEPHRMKQQTAIVMGAIMMQMQVVKAAVS